MLFYLIKFLFFVQYLIMPYILVQEHRGKLIDIKVVVGDKTSHSFITIIIYQKYIICVNLLTLFKWKYIIGVISSTLLEDIILLVYFCFFNNFETKYGGYFFYFWGLLHFVNMKCSQIYVKHTTQHYHTFFRFHFESYLNVIEWFARNEYHVE